jgi:N-acetylneuraminate synthase/sialic acid synthase
MKRELQIGDYKVSDESNPFVIAEIGHNHQGSVELCEAMFESASRSGAQSVKLQKRFNRELYTSDFFNSPYVGPSSFGSTYGEHREFLEFNESQYKHLKKFAEKIGLVFFATAFDFRSIDFLQNLKVPAIKIASGDLKSIPLLRYANKTGIPLIISTGGASISDVNIAMSNVDQGKVGLLQCTAAYPAEASEMNLNVIQTYREKFPQTVIGLSSHDRGISFPVVAAALGARIIEKHFTTDRSLKGTDHAFSLEPTGMEKMCRDLQLIVKALGSREKKPLESEKSGMRKMGKMLVFSTKLKAGTVLEEKHLAIKSPLDGVSAIEWDSFVGLVLKQDVEESEIVKFEHIR